MMNASDTAGEQVTHQYRAAARVDQMLRELSSDLAESVRLGDMTELEANEWLSRKQDAWMAEVV